MTEFLIYLTKLSLVISFVYGAYQLFLKRSTHFAWNRSFLLVGVLLAFSLPFWPVSNTINFIPNSVDLDIGSIGQSGSVGGEVGFAERIDWSFWLGWSYLLGLGLMLLRLVKIDGQIRSLIRASVKEEHPRFTLLRSSGIKAPFSFYRYVFLPASSPPNKATELIISHEQAHIEGRHSFDILLLEFLLLFQWFNPFAWLYKRSLLAIHEYQADQSVMERGASKSDYQLLLLEQGAGSQRFALANAFNEFTTVKRIKMMNQNRSSKWSRIKFLFLIPILGLSLYSFKALPSSNEIVANITGKTLIQGHVIMAADQSPIAGATILVKESSIGTLTNEAGYFEIMIPENSSSTLVFGFIGLESHEVVMQESGIIRVELDRERSKHSFFKSGKAEVDLSKDLQNMSAKEKSPLIILDGKEVTKGFKMDTMSPDDIESVNVIKGEKAIEQYGEKGRNGVVEITTKK
ncbi:MAG: carboxypeptidase-like regulatory domain-containing protein [Bacteroidota bacterium]